MTIAEEIKDSFRHGTALTRLIYINIGMFLLLRIINAFFFFAGEKFTLLNYLAMPASASQLLQYPWTIFTYMFVHFGFLHLLFNVLWLYWLGKIFLRYFDGRKLVLLYLVGGIVGGLFYMVAYNLFPVFQHILQSSQLVGASAGIIAIVIAVAVYVPNYEIYLAFLGPVKMKYIALISVLMYIIGISTTTNAGGNFAHLGGTVVGVLFSLQYKRGHDMLKGFSRLIDSITKLFKPKQKIKISYKNSGNIDIDFNRRKNAEQQLIDEILEKISRSGYDSLTKEEKEILFKMGK